VSSPPASALYFMKPTTSHGCTFCGYTYYGDTCQRVVPHEADVLVPRCRRLGESVLLDAAVDERVVILHDAWALEPERTCRTERAHKAVGVVVTHAPASDLALLHEAAHGLGDLGERGRAALRDLALHVAVLEALPPVGLRRVARRPVEQIDVEVVGAEALQRALATVKVRARVKLPRVRLG
jgi:hypothetical protein